MRFVRLKDLYFISVIALIKAVNLLPSHEQKEFVARGIAFSAYHLSRGKRRSVEKNLSKVFGEKFSEHEKQNIIRGVFHEFWKDTLFFSLSEEEKTALKKAEIQGLDHLQDALKRGRGAILWESGSFGRRNLPKQILHANGFSVHQVHTEQHIGGFLVKGFRSTSRPQIWIRNNIIKPFFEGCEKQFVAEIIYLPFDPNSLAFTRRLLEVLKKNAVICIRADIGHGQKLIPLELLGHTRLFATGMVSLARMSGASILPMFCIQERSGKTTLALERPISIENGIDRENGLRNSVAEYVDLLESYIRRYPEMYRGWHYLDYYEVNRHELLNRSG